MSNTTLHWRLREVLQHLRDEGRWSVMTCYLLHANERNRAWPSIKTLCDETGFSNATVIAAKQWLIDHKALEAVPLDKRVEEEAALHHRCDVMQITGIFAIDEQTTPILHFNDERNYTFNSLTSKHLMAKHEDIKDKDIEDNSSSISSIFQLLESVWGQMVSGAIEAEMWEALAEQYPMDWIKDAMVEVLEVGGGTRKNIKYLRSILIRWKEEGRSTPGDESEQTRPTPGPRMLKLYDPAWLEEVQDD